MKEFLLLKLLIKMWNSEVHFICQMELPLNTSADVWAKVPAIQDYKIIFALTETAVLPLHLLMLGNITQIST